VNEKRWREYRTAKLDWDKAFIDIPCSKRCLCIPFNDELNALYEVSLQLERELDKLLVREK
jgi:hypothetical protein